MQGSDCKVMSSGKSVKISAKQLTDWNRPDIYHQLRSEGNLRGTKKFF